MTKERKRHSAQFKFRAALEAAKETKTINQIASEYELHPAGVKCSATKSGIPMSLACKWTQFR